MVATGGGAIVGDKEAVAVGEGNMEGVTSGDAEGVALVARERISVNSFSLRYFFFSKSLMIFWFIPWLSGVINSFLMVFVLLVTKLWYASVPTQTRVVRRVRIAIIRKSWLIFILFIVDGLDKMRCPLMK